MVSAATAFSAALAGLCTQTITLRTVTRGGAYAEETAATTANHSAYVQRVNAADRDLERDGRVIEWRVYIPSTTLTVTLDDEVELSGTARRILEVDYRYDENGQQFVVLSVGRR